MSDKQPYFVDSFTDADLAAMDALAAKWREESFQHGRAGDEVSRMACMAHADELEEAITRGVEEGQMGGGRSPDDISPMYSEETLKEIAQQEQK